MPVDIRCGKKIDQFTLTQNLNDASVTRRVPGGSMLDNCGRDTSFHCSPVLKPIAPPSAVNNTPPTAATAYILFSSW